MYAEAELLILPDGNLLIHNLTPELALALAALASSDEAFSDRVKLCRRSNQAAAETTAHVQTEHEIPNRG